MVHVYHGSIIVSLFHTNALGSWIAGTVHVYVPFGTVDQWFFELIAINSKTQLVFLVDQLVPWYHAINSKQQNKVLVHVPGYTMVRTRVQIQHYLKNDLKYKHSGATGTLASGRCQHRRHRAPWYQAVHVPNGRYHGTLQ